MYIGLIHLKLYILVMGKILLSVLLLAGISAGAENIVVVGDSHMCGPFGNRMFQDLKSAGHQVKIYCMVSASPKHWINGQRAGNHQCQEMSHSTFTPCGGTGDPPSLQTLLANHPGARMVIALGTNSLWSPNVNSYYSDMASQIRAAGVPCDWIGPPHLDPSKNSRYVEMEANLNGFYSSLKSEVEPTCPVVDSRDITAPGTVGFGTSDGVHRTRSAAEYWADQVVPRLGSGFHTGATRPVFTIPALLQGQQPQPQAPRPSQPETPAPPAPQQQGPRLWYFVDTPGATR